MDLRDSLVVKTCCFKLRIQPHIADLKTKRKQRTREKRTSTSCRIKAGGVIEAVNAFARCRSKCLQLFCFRLQEEQNKAAGFQGMFFTYSAIDLVCIVGSFSNYFFFSDSSTYHHFACLCPAILCYPSFLPCSPSSSSLLSSASS